ncbi:aminopeptidase N-like [Glandiceps talaboti]
MGRENNIMANDIRTTTLKIEMSHEGYVVSKTKVSFVVFVILLFVVVILTLAVLVTQNVWKDICNEPIASLPLQSKSAKREFEGRLPNTLRPINYKIKLTPYLDVEDAEKQFLFDGELVMQVECQANTRRITLHANELNIDEDTITISDKNNNLLSIRAITMDDLYEFLIIDIHEEMTTNEDYRIEMNYMGTMNNSDYLAFYISTYNHGNATRHVALSQLEMSYARRVFPCFDEPLYKATFDITITHRIGRIALSNMPRIRNESNGDWMTVTFGTTPVMSVYTLAIAVIDFPYKETTSVSGTKVRVWAREEMIENAEYALRVAADMLDFLNDLFLIKYSLPKLDMVAAPDFSFGAMENWGLVFYAELRMLYNKTSETPTEAQSVANIVGHELVHQWFGNLVTMEWWEHTWLNEGFARYFEYVAVDAVEKSWDIFNQFFQNDITFHAMARDVESDAHATIMNVGWHNEIRRMFDSRGYERGASMNQMMKSFLGEEAYMEGLRQYLQSFMYKTTVTDNLWHHLTEASIGRTNIDVKKVMDPWLHQTGFPLVTIKRTSDVTAIADQTVCVDNPNMSLDFGQKWYIPLTYTHSGRLTLDNPEHVWLEKGSVPLELFGGQDEDWILANINHYGFYRVNYDEDNWNKLIVQLNTDFTVIPLRNRVALLDDAFSLSHSLDIDAVIALKLTEHLQRETKNYSPWSCVMIHFTFLKNMLERTPSYSYYKKYLRRLIKPVYEELGWNFTYHDHVTYHLRRTAVELACFAENPDCLDRLVDAFDNWADGQDLHRVPNNMLDMVLCDAIEFGTEEDWEFLFGLLNESISIQYFLKYALSCTKDYTLIKRYMEESLALGDVFDIITNIRDNSLIGYHLAWDFVMDNFEFLVQLDENKAFYLVWSFAKKMNEDKDLLLLKDFGREYNDMPESVVDSFYEALQIVEWNVAWMTKNYNNVYDWLKQAEGGKG